jgi:hypothetical protein
MSFCREQTIHSTRRKCRCFWCGEILLIGSVKIYTALVYEGDFFADNWHPECHEAMGRWLKFQGYRGGGELPDKHTMQRGGIEER